MDECEKLLLRLPKARNWVGTYLYQYQGVWCEPKLFPALLSFQNHFQPLPSDIIIATFPKSGTTWLKALAFSITTRTLHSPLTTHSPLLSSNPHTLVPFLELDLFYHNPSPPLRHLPSPRLLSTHVAYDMLPTSMHDTKCRILYLCRNPLDQFVSHYMFSNKITSLLTTEARNVELSEAFDEYCKGVQFMGPPWDHAYGYWKRSVERPDEVLFLRYEDLKEDEEGWVRRIGEFLGCPFTEEEEERGVVGEVVRVCSFESMKNVEVNKSGEYNFGVKNSVFFRKGEVGDWVNYLTTEMVERVERVIEQKLVASELNLDFNRLLLNH